MTTPPIATAVHGSAAADLEPLRNLLASGLAGGDELGAAVCVVRDGEVLADLWGGVADPTTAAPWQRDTVVNVFSVTKTVTALAVLLLADRGELDLDAPIAKYWPEFAAAGKDGVLVRHVLGHASGVSGWQQPTALADLYDLDRSTALLAAQEPWWTPGDGSGYHAMNFGHLLNPVVQAVTGQSIGHFVRDELAGPLGVGFTIGTPPDVLPRIATVVPPQRSPGIDYSKIPADSVIRKTLLNPVLDPREVNTPQWRTAELGAVNGHGSARDLARLHMALVHRAGDAVSLRRDSVEGIFQVQAEAIDRVLYTRIRWGMGFALGWPAEPAGEANRVALPDDDGVCWWVGWGGSFVLDDVARGVTVVYVTNRMAHELIHTRRGMGYVRAAYQALGFCREG